MTWQNLICFFPVLDGMAKREDPFVPVSRLRWTILISAWLVLLMSWLPRMIYPPLMSEIQAALYLSNTEAGFLMTAFWIGYTVVQIPSGFICDRFDIRKMCVCALVLVGISSVLAGTATNYGTLLAYRVLNGVACGFLWAPSLLMVLRSFSQKEKALATGILGTAPGIGMTAAFAASPSIALVFGSWKWSFLVLSVPVFAAAIIIALLTGKISRLGALRSEDKGIRKNQSYSLFLKNKSLRLIALMMFCSSLVGQAVSTWAPKFFQENFDITAVAAGFIMSLRSGLGIFSGLTAGIIADSLLRRRAPVMFLAVFVMGIGLGVTALSTKAPLSFNAAVIISAGFFGSMAYTIEGPLLTQWSSLAVIGAASGFVNFLDSVGSSVGPTIYGWVLDVSGSFVSGWATMSLIALAFSMLAVLLVKYERRQTQNDRGHV